MPVFNFPQFECKSFWNYFSRLNDYRAQLNRNFEKWEICEVILEGLNIESRSYIGSIFPGGLRELLSKTSNEVWDFFEKLAWETYAVEQANTTFRYPTHGEYDFHANSYPSYHFVNSSDSFHSYMPPVLCDYCEFPDHDAYTCPYRDYIDVTCASFEKKINEMTEKMVETMKLRIAEYSQCFNQIRETSSEIDSSLGFPKPDISLYEDSEPSYSARLDSNESMLLPSLGQEHDPPTSLSADLVSCTSSPKGVTDDVLVSVNLPTTLNNFCELEVGEQYDFNSELKISITPESEFHDLDESKDISQELHDEVT